MSRTALPNIDKALNAYMALNPSEKLAFSLLLTRIDPQTDELLPTRRRKEPKSAPAEAPNA